MAGLVVLDPFNLKGISPPFDVLHTDEELSEKGSQEYYIGFPELIISKGKEIRNWVINLKYNQIPKTYTVTVLEGDRLINDKGEHYSEKLLPELIYTLDSDFYPIDVKMPDGKFQQYLNILTQLGMSFSFENQKELYNYLLKNIYLIKDTNQILPIKNQ